MASLNESPDRHQTTTSIGPAWLLQSQRELWVLVGIALVVDTAVTGHGIANGLQELNPVARRVYEFGGVAALGGLKAAVAGMAAVVWFLLPMKYASVIPLALAIPWSLASTFNVVLVLIVL